mgnify:CR=1 FL=1
MAYKKPEPKLDEIVDDGRKREYPHSLLRWTYGTERSRPDSISQYRTPAVHRTYGKEYPEICCQQRYEGFCKRLKNDLYRSG